ncbi:MAG: hypothetical protein R2852_03155 [Bacteroidia bacterium]
MKQINCLIILILFFSCKTSGDSPCVGDRVPKLYVKILKGGKNVVSDYQSAFGIEHSEKLILPSLRTYDSSFSLPFDLNKGHVAFGLLDKNNMTDTFVLNYDSIHRLKNKCYNIIVHNIQENYISTRIESLNILPSSYYGHSQAVLIYLK